MNTSNFYHIQIYCKIINITKKIHIILITKKPAHHIDERANYLLFLTEALTKIGEPTAESYFTSLRDDRGKPLRCRK